MTIVAAPSIREAVEAGRELVALETSVLAQGLPEPSNRRAAEAMEAAVRASGAEPAWIWTDAGAVRIGATEGDLERLMKDAAKVGRRDLPMALAAGTLGATTVSATVWAAHRFPIEVAATGGIGGVHPRSGDVSADLAELARIPVTLVCSGPKSILDPAATLERLEELGVAVLGYRSDTLPFFLVRQTDLPLEHRVEDPKEVATVIEARRGLGIASTLLVCNPCPEDRALAAEEVRAAVARCAGRAEAAPIAGKEVTPFLLRCLADETHGRSLEANLALLEANARLAGEIASAR